MTRYLPHYPVIFQSKTLNQIVESVLETTKDIDKIPYFYYHIPRFTNVKINVVDLNAALSEQVDSYLGLKFTSSRLDEAVVCNDCNTRCRVLYGMDELYLNALMFGIKCMVGSTYNFLGEYFNEVKIYYDSGSICKASELQALINKFLYKILRFAPLASQKYAMREVGLDFGGVRNPLLNVNTNQEILIYNELKNLKRILSHYIN